MSQYVHSFYLGLILYFIFTQVQTFVKKNIVLTGGFAGGFLLGLAS